MSTAYRLRLKIVSNTGKKRVGLGPYVYWKSGRPASVSEKSSQGSDHSRSPGGKGAGSLNRIDPGFKKYLVTLQGSFKDRWVTPAFRRTIDPSWPKETAYLPSGFVAAKK